MPFLVSRNTLHCRNLAAVQSRKPSQKYKKPINMFLFAYNKFSINISLVTILPFNIPHFCVKNVCSEIIRQK